MTPQQRQEFSKLGLSARWAPRTKQDVRIGSRLKATFAKAIHEAVDTMFYGFAKGGGPRVLVIHQGDARLMEPGSKDCRIQQQRFPGSIIGTYDNRATRGQVMDDIAEICDRLHSV